MLEAPTAATTATVATTATALTTTAPAASEPSPPPAAVATEPAATELAATLPPAPAAPAPALAPAPVAPAPKNFASPSLNRIVFFISRIGPSGKIAASARLFARSLRAEPRQRAQSLTWRRTGALSDEIPSAAAPSSRRTSLQVSLRASAASASRSARAPAAT